MVAIDKAAQELMMTKHADARRQQRGVRTEVLRLVVTEGDKEHDAGAGICARSFSRRRLSQLSASNISKSVLDQAAHTVVLIGQDGSIVTVINHQTWNGRFYRGAKRHNPRRLSRNGRRSTARR